MAEEKKRTPPTWQHTWELLDTAERLNRTFFLRRAAAARPVWEPPVDVYESTDATWIVVALPGVEPERVEISVEGRELIVAGERSRPRECSHLAVRRLEIPAGRFERRVEMPPGRYRLDSREMLNGCLVVQLTRL
ncbi:MAG TPA: Hsp20/alpha crystallin family protein [Planctomycetota bacterium]|jgi:HSP20 family molecular chaperone IbpA|nr:Hsp20/alpha crystallin family protein [Planctomycetota bacterium]